MGNFFYYKTNRCAYEKKSMKGEDGKKIIFEQSKEN